MMYMCSNAELYFLAIFNLNTYQINQTLIGKQNTLCINYNNCHIKLPAN